MELVITDDLLALRLAASRFFVVFLWLQVPLVTGISVLNGMPPGRPCAIVAALAAGASMAVWRFGAGAAVRAVVAAALTIAPIVVVYAGAGHWRLDRFLFVVFGMLIAYVDWRPIAIAGALVAVADPVLAMLLPAAFSLEPDLAHRALRGGIVLVDTLVFLTLTDHLRRLFVRLAERRTEIGGLNATLALKVGELESAFERLENETAARKAVAGKLEYLTHHDPISGLPNRVLLIDRLDQAVAAAARARSELLVISLDCENLKQINDTLGHAIGEDAVAATAARIARCLRSGDIVSQIAGDEFVIVCAAADGVKEAPHVIARLFAAITEPLPLESGAVSLIAAIGISLYPADGADAEDLVRKAAAAMYRARKSGPNTFQLHTPEMHDDMLAEWELLHDLERAVRDNEFVVHYQPIVSLTSRAIIGAEALVRWNHPARGLLGPGAFIGFAEEHGLIGQIGQIVLETACAHIRPFGGVTNDQFTMAINVSAIQFRQPDFVSTAMRALEAHGVDRSLLEIEITESVIMNNAEAVISTLHSLATLGVKLSIDDFGTGYSSLAYLKSFPIQTLKIDRSFVSDIAVDATDQAIAATIIALAHNLGMRVIAEGVETQEQLEQIHLLGADDVQGYLVSRPLPAAEFLIFARAYEALSRSPAELMAPARTP